MFPAPTLDTMTTRQQTGRTGEDLAADWVRRRGWAVLDRNWRCADGEIDLVVRDGDDLVVVEVKTRRGLGFGHPAEAVTRAKLARLRRLAARWLSAHDLHPAGVWVEVLAVLLLPGAEPVVERLEGLL